MIFDDLPADCIEAIQAEDRIHRIDPHRLTHPTVRYYTMQSSYPARFLETMKHRWIVKDESGRHYREFTSEQAAKAYADTIEREYATAYDTFFAQGTYDELHSLNLKTQRTMFRLINDGIADETILKEGQNKFRGIENGDM